MSKHIAMQAMAYSPIEVPAESAVRAFGEVARSLNKRRPDPELDLDFSRDLQLPLDASLHVPVSAVALYLDDERSFHITLAPSRAKQYFPHFHGALRLEPATDLTCRLALSGEYTVPLGPIGKTIDMTFLRGAAEAGLQRFTDVLAQEIEQRVLRQSALAQL